MATESVATEKSNPRAPISNWDLGNVDFALKKIRAIAGMGVSTTDIQSVDDMNWIMLTLSEIAHDAIKIIETHETTKAAED